MDGNVTHLHHPAEQKMAEWVWNGQDFNIRKVEKEKREGKTKRRTVERGRGQFEIWSIAKPNKHVPFLWPIPLMLGLCSFYSFISKAKKAGKIKDPEVRTTDRSRP